MAELVRGLANASIAGDAAIDDGKMRHRHVRGTAQAPGTAVVAETKDVHIVRGTTGLVLAFRAAITGAIATGADRTVTVDLQKSTGLGAFASILSAVITFNNGSTLYSVSSAALSSTGLAVGDILRIVIAVAGAAGAQAQGVIAQVDVSETPT